jgi:hypothetical protein
MTEMLRWSRIVDREVLRRQREAVLTGKCLLSAHTDALPTYNYRSLLGIYPDYKVLSSLEWSGTKSTVILITL